MSIGLSLFRAGAREAGKNWAVAAVTIALIFLFAHLLPGLLRKRQNGNKDRVIRRWLLPFRGFPILLAVVVVYIGCVIFAPAGSSAQVDFGLVKSAPWIKTSGFVLPWGFPKFSLAFVVAILAAYLASMIESLGDYNACATDCGLKLDEKTVNRGIIALT